MHYSLEQDGFEIHRGVISSRQISELREEADSVATSAESACVRHLRSRSRIFNDLGVSQMIYTLIPKDLRPVRSILFDKTARENWPVAWHQDLTITVSEKRQISGYGPWSHKDGSPHVQPPISLLQNMITVRLHLDDTPSSNGALRVIPRSHKFGRISASDIAEYAKANEVVCECKAGDVVLISPLLLHSSRRSATPLRRRVIHFEYASSTDLEPNLSWFEPLE